MRRAAPALVLLAAACRPDIGAPVYLDPPPIGSDTDDTADGFLPGPDPYEAGEERLSIGVFYEGGASEVVAIDNLSTHFYIYENSFSVQTSDERVEGFASDVLVRGGGAWWGGGVHWDAARDLGDWTTLHVHLRTPDAGFSGFELGMVGGGTEGRVLATDHGFATDGAWHGLAVPLSAFAGEGVDLGAVTVALLVIAETGSAGESLWIDNVYLTAE